MNTLEALKTLGVPRTHIGVIGVLMDNKPHTMHEIERIADLRQPEVSKAVTTLAPHLGISLLKGSVGRPQHVVQMKPSQFKDYVRYIVRTVKAERIKQDEAIKSLGR